MADKETVAEKKAWFTKEQLLSSKKYRERRDLLSVLLEDGKQYSHGEVKQLMQRFMEKKVK